MKAVLHYGISPRLRARLLASAPEWLQVISISESDEPRLFAGLFDADVLLHVLTPVSKAVMEAAPRLKLIQKIGVGVNTIDLQEAGRRAIRVANMPGTNSQSVCEMTLTLLLAVVRKVIPMDAATRRGEGWSLPLGTTDDVTEIHGKTVGLIGFGEIPGRLAPVLQALGARVIFWSRRDVLSNTAKRVSLDRLFAESDIISLHVPLTEETHHLICAKSLETMKPGGILINTARGGLVDEFALYDALTSGKLRAAGLDVFYREPPDKAAPLLSLPNVVVTPHVSWLTAETLDRSFKVAFENCTRLRDGRPLLHEIAT
jgi:phosphoglycerate dehydrogenase-like enzyme